MPFIFKRLALLTSIAAVLAPNKAWPASKDQPKFTPGPAASYESHQTSEKVTIGVAAYVSDEETRPVFGKHNPYTYGVLPVLVVIQNDGPKTIRVDPLELVLVGPNRDRVDATPAKDVRFLTGPNKPSVAPHPYSQNQLAQKSSGYLGNRGAGVCRENAATGPVGQRLYLFSERIPARIEPVSERAEGSRFGERAAVF